MNQREQLIFDAFNDPAQGFISASRLYRKLRDQYPNLGFTVKEVHNVVSRIARQQQFQPMTGSIDSRYDSIWAPAIRDSYQVDLADMANLKKQNSGVSFIFICIDVHSRYALWLTCKRKSIEFVKPCFEAVFALTGVPNNITTDFEAAVLSNEVQQYLTSLNIKHWPVKDEKKRNNSMVERNIRTMRELLHKAFASYGTRRWTGPMLPAVNENYNNSYNRMIKATPISVWNGTTDNAQVPKQHAYPFKIGDQVRVRKVVGFKDPLLKTSTMKTWTKAVYTIVARDGRRFVAQNNKSRARTPRMGYELQLVPANTLEFTPPKDSIYSTKKQTGTEARMERTALQREQELARETSIKPMCSQHSSALQHVKQPQHQQPPRQPSSPPNENGQHPNQTTALVLTSLWTVASLKAKSSTEYDGVATQRTTTHGNHERTWPIHVRAVCPSQPFASLKPSSRIYEINTI